MNAEAGRNENNTLGLNDPVSTVKCLYTTLKKRWASVLVARVESSSYMRKNRGGRQSSSDDSAIKIQVCFYHSN